MAVEEWMAAKEILPIHGLHQLVIERDVQGSPLLLIAEVINDFIIAGLTEQIHGFHNSKASRFVVGRCFKNYRMIFTRLHLYMDKERNIDASTKEYMETIDPISLTKERRERQDEACTEPERLRFLGLTGALNFLGHGILPQASFPASHLQKRVGSLKVSDLIAGNNMLGEIKLLSPSLALLSPAFLENPSYLPFSDVSQGSQSCGQTGYLSGIFLPAEGRRVYHVLDWLSCKQQMVSFSSIGAEILGAATSNDRGSHMAERLRILQSSREPILFVLTVDSHGLYSTVTTLHGGADYRLPPTVPRILDSFEVGDISIMQGIPGIDNLSDALTKQNVVMYQRLNHLMKQGILPKEITRDNRRVN